MARFQLGPKVPVRHNFNGDPSFETQLHVNGKYNILVKSERTSILYIYFF